MNSNTNIINGLKTNQLAHSVCHGILIEQFKYFSGLRTVIQKFALKFSSSTAFCSKKIFIFEFHSYQKVKKLKIKKINYQHIYWFPRAPA